MLFVARASSGGVLCERGRETRAKSGGNLQVCLCVLVQENIMFVCVCARECTGMFVCDYGCACVAVISLVRLPM